MAIVRQITEIITMPLYFICNENLDDNSFDIISNAGKKIYNIKCIDSKEYVKMMMWTDKEWDSNLPIIKRELV